MDNIIIHCTQDDVVYKASACIAFDDDDDDDFDEEKKEWKTNRKNR